MPRNSLPSLRAQIAKLEQKAETIKRQVVARLQREITAHGLTAEDLFGTQGRGGSTVGDGRNANAASKTKAGAKREAKYGDSEGNVWGGMGKRPQWLKERLEAGASLDEFLLVGRPAAKGVKKSAGKASAEAPADVTAKRGVKARRASPGRKKAAAKAASKTRTPRKTAARVADATE
jgi:DNA-binding protein H-NS